jgi:nucleoside-diphosphate-sugar epimerase
MDKMVVALTGATGLLGSNILFELLKRYEDSPGSLTIWVLGRPGGHHSLRERIRQLLANDGAHYLHTPDTEPLLECIQTVDFHLDQPNLGIPEDSFRKMKKEPPHLFIHAAAALDFRDQPAVIAQLQKINVEGTQRALNLAEALGTPGFAMISTAYVCGIRSGVVTPDFTAEGQPFRNPYERSKLDGERLVRRAQQEGRFRRGYFFRPTPICGRLIEPPVGYTPKFDVFYAWLAFFLRLKKRQLGRMDYEASAKIDIRVALKPGSGLNIIPADYAAKALVEVSLQQPASNAFHLASPHLTDNYEDLPALLKFINVHLPAFVDEMPPSLNALENLYYHRSVGKIYDPYISKPVPDFSLDSLHQNLPTGFPECPAVKGAVMTQLLKFAKKHDFGL